MSDLPAFRLVRRASVPHALTLDAAQVEVVDRRQGSGPLRVLGAPGTGRTTVLVEVAATRVDRDGVAPDAVLLLAPSRRAAAELRDQVTRRLGRTVREPLARSVHSYAFGLLRRHAALAGDPPPRLLAAPEQDLILRDLLAGHRAGDGRSPGWPETLRPALGTRGFRTELRDLFARAVERGVDPAGLAELGRRHARPDWVAAAALMAEYLDVTALRSPGAHDPAGLVQAAADVLEAEPALLTAERDRWAVVLVDDFHDADRAAARLLRLVRGGGRDLVVAGDPDSAVLDFRGGDPGLLREFCTMFRTPDGGEAASITLRTSWRRPPTLIEAAARVTRRLPGPGGHRLLQAPPGLSRGADPQSAVEAHVLRSETAEAAYVAHRLRAARLRRDGETVGWSQMAVIARTATRLASLRRALTSAGVPVAVASSQLTVREQPAVVPLLTALRVVLEPATLDPETAVALLASPLGGGDAMALRRLRQGLRREERAGGGGRPSDALLVEALGDPGWLATLDLRDARPARRVATVLAAGRAALARDVGGAATDGVGDGVTAETVLWALWQASGLEEPWRRTALAGGPSAQRADHDLDAVVALFDAAARFVDRLPAAGPAAFLDYLLGQEVPGDTLAERAPSDDAVSLLTVHTATGREWDLVVVAGVYDGVWPDLRPRGSLLGSEQLVDVVSGRGGSPQAALAQMRVEEARLFHVALTRARRQVIVTSVDDDDHQPSPLLDLVDPLPATHAEGARPLTPVPRALALRAVVAELRQVVTSAPVEVPDAHRHAAARQLARLARAGVRGARPDEWYALAALSDDGPLRGPDDLVTVSPSRVEGFERCALRWLLETAGGTAVDSLGQTVGSLVHEIAAELPAGQVDELRAELERAWPRLELDEGWVGQTEAERAATMVAKLADYFGAHDRELVAVETDFDVTVGRARVHGRVDRLERDADGRLVVVDLKTGKSKPPRAELARHAQLGVYQLAVQQGAFDELTPGERRSGGAALVQLGDGTKATTPQQQAPLAEDDEPGWAAELVARAADGMAAATFPATGNPLCRACPVRHCCPLHAEGRAVTS